MHEREHIGISGAHEKQRLISLIAQLRQEIISNDQQSELSLCCNILWLTSLCL